MYIQANSICVWKAAGVGAEAMLFLDEQHWRFALVKVGRGCVTDFNLILSLASWDIVDVYKLFILI